MLRFVFGLAICAVAVAALLAPRASRPAAACTGGSGLIEEFAKSEVIAIGDAVRIGDNVNRAPALTPTASATATTTPSAVATTSSASSATPSATIPPLPTEPPLDFTGIGATLSVVRQISGAPASTVEVDAGSRAVVERAVRDIEARQVITDCAPDRFVPHFALGQRYLVFAYRDETGQLTTRQLYPVEGDTLLLQDAALIRAGLSGLAMLPGTYRAFFADQPADVGRDIALLRGDRVPLSEMIRAVQALRVGGVSIGPPDTGSAGLAAQRPRLVR